MGNLQEALEKIGVKAADTTDTKCACGKPKQPKFPTCRDCEQKYKTAGANKAANGLPTDYLNGGYFNIIKNKRYIKEEVFLRWARGTSNALKNEGMTSAAIRRFFTKVRAIEYKFKITKDFELAREGLYAFPGDASYTENRGVTKPLFTEFIEKNIAEAKKDAEHFRAFVEHFKCVIAFFKEKKKGA